MSASARLTISFTALGLLLSACGRGDVDSASDEQIRKQLPGIWVFDAKYASGYDRTSTLSIVPDGSYVCRIAARTPTNGLRTVEIEGAFRVEDGFLIDTITKNSQTNGPVGTSSRARIVRLDDRAMVLEYETVPGVGSPTNEVVFRRQTE